MARLMIGPRIEWTRSSTVRGAGIIAALTACALLAARAGHAQGRTGAARRLAVIVNPRVPAQNLSVDDVRDLFTAQRQFWGPRVRVTLVLQAADSLVHQAFLERVLGMAADELDRTYSDKRYRGVLAAEIIVVRGSEAARSIVAQRPTAIAYVWSDEVDGTVRVAREF